MAIKVYSRPLPFNASREDKDRAFKGMWAAFKRLVNECGVLNDYSKHQSAETEGQKKRRKQNESRKLREKEAIKDKWREHF